MANPVQWTVERFYDELRRLDRAGRDAVAALNDQKLDLQTRYTYARNNNFKASMQFLTPLIHKNSQLRLKAQDYRSKFNGLLATVSGLLKKAGLQVPTTLNGLGIAPALVIVPATAIAIMLVAWGIVNGMNSGRAAIDSVLDKQGPLLIARASNPAASPAERKSAQDAYDKLLEEAGARGTEADWARMVVPGLALVALIVLGPSVMRALPSRGRAA